VVAARFHDAGHVPARQHRELDREDAVHLPAADLEVDQVDADRVELASDEYALLTGPVLSRIFFERRPVTDQFIQAVVTQWLTTRP
jgi:hypothetical protein